MHRRLLYLPMICLCVACGHTPEEQAYLDEVAQDAPVQEAFDVAFLFSEKAVLQARLTAPHVIEKIENEQTSNIFDRGLKVEFFTPEGTVKSNLEADHGVFKDQFGMAILTGDVKVVNENGERLNTEKLIWDNKSNRISSNEFVKIQTAKEIIYGDSMDANTDFTEYRIYKIRGTVQMNEAP